MRLKCTTKKKDLNREEYITELLEDTVTEGYIIKIYASRETFGFAMAVIISTRSPTAVNT